MTPRTALLPLATEQARKCYESQRQHDKNPGPDHYDKVDRLALIHCYFNAGDYYAGQDEAIEFAKLYDTQMPRILVEFTDMCQAVSGWTSLQSR